MHKSILIVILYISEEISTNEKNETLLQSEVYLRNINNIIKSNDR